MPMSSEANDSTTRRRSSVLRLLATGALTLLAGGIIAGCAATAPAAPTATAAPKAEVATVAPAAPTEPTATAAAPEGVPPGPPPGGAGAPPKVITPTLTNIAYATASGTQMLDLYLPEGNGPFPVVVNIHPGGFFTGDKEMLPGTPGKAMLEAGYAIASINYRLSSEATFPAAVQDAKAAVRFLRANAAEYKLNPDKIAAFGQSAGGNLASMLGTSGDVAEFDDPSLGNAGVSSRVQAVINWFGPNDFAVMDEQAKAQGCSASDQTHSAADSPESKYLGAPVPTVPDLVNQANPITYITEDDPPFLVQKGDQDCTIAIENTKMLADALAAAGLDVHYDLLKGVGHGDGFGEHCPRSSRARTTARRWSVSSTPSSGFKRRPRPRTPARHRDPVCCGCGARWPWCARRRYDADQGDTNGQGRGLRLSLADAEARPVSARGQRSVPAHRQRARRRVQDG